MKRRASILGTLAMLLGGLTAAPAGAAAELQTVIKGIDIVGVPASQVGDLLGLLGLQEGMRLPYTQIKEALVRPTETKLEGTGRFRAVSVQPTTFIGGKEDGATYLTISVIDRSAAMSPTSHRYVRLTLPRPVEAFFTERVRGPGAFRDTLLPSDRDRLEALAEAHATDLERALGEAQDPGIRSRAAQAIAFHPDARRARLLLEASLSDPDAGVRRDVARALHPLVMRQGGRTPISLEPYLALIRLPESSDRLNAAAMLLTLASTPENRTRLFREAGAPLLAMARMKHPSERTLALEALQVLAQTPAPEPWEAYRKLWEEKTAQRFAE
jgi:hypothetical protein